MLKTGEIRQLYILSSKIGKRRVQNFERAFLAIFRPNTGGKRVSKGRARPYGDASAIYIYIYMLRECKVPSGHKSIHAAFFLWEKFFEVHAVTFTVLKLF